MALHLKDPNAALQGDLKLHALWAAKFREPRVHVSHPIFLSIKWFFIALSTLCPAMPIIYIVLSTFVGLCACQS